MMMIASESKVPQLLPNQQRSAIDNKKLWDSFRIDFHHVVREFPNNKLYAIIDVHPESARKLIKHFTLFVNNHKREEFQSDFHNISIAGFNIRPNEITSVYVKIQAIPKDDKWEKRESKLCGFFFNGQVLNLSPIINFEWNDQNCNHYVSIRWQKIDHPSARKYILLLDDEEIHYVCSEPLPPELKVRIEDLEPNTQHTIQIILNTTQRKQKVLSDLIRFTVPTDRTDNSPEVLQVRAESVPDDLLEVIEIEEETVDSEPESDRFRDNALELLERLRRQIEKRESSRSSELAYLPRFPKQKEHYKSSSTRFFCHISVLFEI